MTPVPRPRLHSKDLFDDFSDIYRRLRRLEARTKSTTGWVNSGIVNSFGVHTVTAMGGKLWNRVANVNFHITLGAVVAVGGQGGIANIHVADFIAPWIPEANDGQFLVSSSAPLIIASITSNGQLALVNSVPGATIPNGLQIVLGGTYLL